MISFEANMRDLEREIRGLAERVKDMLPVARDFGAHMVRRWTRSFRRTTGREPGAAGGPPAVQNAGLRNSLTFAVREEGEAVEMGSPLAYARIQHEGGEIRPKQKRALTVPISDAAYGKRARDFAGLFFIKAGPGEEAEDVGILARKAPGGIEPMFALRRRVTLPARPWLIIDDQDVRYLGQTMQRHLTRER